MTDKMTFAERAEDKLVRARRVERWPGFFTSMTEKTGATVKDFCKAHGLDNTYLCHIMAGRRGASWDIIMAVETALESAGVPVGNHEDNRQEKSGDENVGSIAVDKKG